MRHALSATLLGWAALAHATTPKTGDDQQWMRVDLDNVPGLVIGAVPTAGKPEATHEQKKRKHGKSDAKKSDERRAALDTPTAAPTVAPEVTKAEGGGHPVEPAQPLKEKEPTVQALPQKDLKPQPSAGPAPVTQPSTPPAAVLTAPQQSPKNLTPAAVPPSVALVEPAQSGQVAKKIEAAPEVVKAPVTFALSPKDRTIRAGLERWAASAGWKLSWEIDEKSQSGGVVRFDADFGADFDTALSKLAGAMRSEVRTHAYLYVGNKVLRIMEEPAKPVVQPAVLMTPMIPDGAQKDTGDRGLAYVTRVKGYWLGASGTESEAAPPQSLPPVFNASVSLIFSDKASIGTVTGILSKVTGIAILLPGAIEYPAASLFVNDAPIQNKKKKAADAKSKRTYTGTPRALLDRISVSTGMLWEYKDETIVFTE